VERWRKQVEEGYQIIYVKDGDKVVAAAGYRFLNTMAWGHILYIDDLVALQTSQRTDLGTLLLRHLQNEARERGCEAVHVDTGYQRHQNLAASDDFEGLSYRMIVYPARFATSSS
jgi:GNAT superfamily N-acetyltransferase